MHYGKKLQVIALCTVCLLSIGTLHAGQVTGQWDFDSGDYTASIGTDLNITNLASAGSVIFGAENIAGNSANIIDVPALGGAADYILMHHGAVANGGGAFVNNWTLIMDINFTVDTAYSSIINTDLDNTSDTDMFRRGSSDGIDIGPGTIGNVPAGTWVRLAIARDQTNNETRLYIEGISAGAVSGAGLDGGTSLYDTHVVFLGDNDGDTGPIKLDSVQFRNYAIDNNEAAALGAADHLPIPLTGSAATASVGAIGGQVTGFTFPVPSTITVEGTSGTVNVTGATLNALNGFGAEFAIDATAIPFTLNEGETNSAMIITWTPGAAVSSRLMELQLTVDNGISPLTFPFSSAVLPAVTQDLVGHFLLDGNANDSSGQGNNGTENNGPVYTVDAVTGSNSLTFDGTDDFVDLGLSTDWDMGVGQDFSVAMWLKTSFVGWANPISNKTWDPGGVQGWLMSVTPGGTTQFNISDGTDRSDATYANISDGNWHHLVVTIDQAGDVVQTYVDGAPTGSTGIGALDSAISGANLFLGQSSGGQAAYQYPGQMDEVGIWRRKLDASEAAAIYNQGLAGVTIDSVGPTPVLGVVTSGALTFQWLDCVTTQVTEIIISNPGGQSQLVIDNIALTGVDAGEFSFGGGFNDAISYTINPDNSVTVPIVWAAALTSGTRAAALTFTHNDPFAAGGSPASVAITPSIEQREATQTNLASGRILYMEFEGDFTDSSGLSNDGTASTPTAPSFVANGLVGLSGSFNSAQNTYLDLGVDTGSDFDFGTNVDFTMSMWVKPATLAGQDCAIFSNKDWNSGGNAGYVISNDQGSDRIKWNVTAPPGGRQDANGWYPDLVDDGIWHHILCVIDRDGNSSFYADGQLAQEFSTNAGDMTTGNNVVIGADGVFSSVWARWYHGELDELTVWNRTLSPAEAEYVHFAGWGSNSISSVLAADIKVNPNFTELAIKNDANPVDFTFSIASTGNSEANLTSFTVIGAHASEYTFVGGTPADQALKASKTMDVTVRWTPNLASPGTRDSTFQFNHDGAGSTSSPYQYSLANQIADPLGVRSWELME